MSSFHTLYDLASGDPIISVRYMLGQWGSVKERVADVYECDEDEVTCVETEEYLDAVAVRGEVVAAFKRGI